MKQRHTLDAYYTATKLTDALIYHVLLDEAEYTDLIYEPCVGKHSITNALHAKGFMNLHTNDIDTSLHNVDTHNDASIYDESLYKAFDWVITNPPYIQPQCQQILENSMKYARKGICMLLRLTYDEPCANRREFLRKNHMSHQLIFNPRPRFRNDTKGSDSATSCWFVWMDKYQSHPNVVGTQKIYVTDWM
jgi:hypothetical protein